MPIANTRGKHQKAPSHLKLGPAQLGSAGYVVLLSRATAPFYAHRFCNHAAINCTEFHKEKDDSATNGSGISAVDGSPEATTASFLCHFRSETSTSSPWAARQGELNSVLNGTSLAYAVMLTSKHILQHTPFTRLQLDHKKNICQQAHPDPPPANAGITTRNARMKAYRLCRVFSHQLQ